MKKTLLTTVSVVSILGLNIMALAPTALAATSYTTLQKQINVNGQELSSPSGFISGGTTYMPIYYIMQALKKIGVQNVWQDNSWTITTPSGSSITASSTPGNGADSVYVNGSLVYRLNGIANIDPASGVMTTYMPIWYIMQIVQRAGMQSSWDGTTWGVTAGTTSSTSSSTATTSTTPSSTSTSTPGGTATGGATDSANGSDNTSAGQSPVMQATGPNQATDDTSYWERASNNLYLNVFTNSDYSPSTGTTMFDAQPGQTLYLMAYSDTQNITSTPQWFVNSPDATITNGDSNEEWMVPSLSTSNSYQGQAATFVAEKPGIYTVQAEVNGSYTVPLVVIVGMNQLSGAAVQVSTNASGVLPLPTGLPATASQSDNSIQYTPYQPVNGWLPVQGTAPSGTKVMTVDLQTSSGQEWNYALPVAADGSFSGLVRLPFHGDVVVGLIPDILNSLNASSSFTPAITYDVNVAVATMSDLDRALLSSTLMDWNLSPEFSQTASILVDNSPSKETAMAAISNYASEKVIYDWPDYNANKSVWADSTLTWNSNLGVCQDIAELAACMFKSVGIPAETVVGTAPKNATKDDHEWLQVWNGSSWMIMDPTWNSANQNVNVSLSSEFMTNTESLQSSHTVDTTQVGTWQ